MKRLVKYRFFRDKKGSTVGIAYNGYEEDPPNSNITCFIHHTMEITHVIYKPIEELSIEDSYEFGYDNSFYWDKIETYEASGTEDEITPDDLIEKEWQKEFSLEQQQHRKTA